MLKEDGSTIFHALEEKKDKLTPSSYVDLPNNSDKLTSCSYEELPLDSLR